MLREQNTQLSQRLKDALADTRKYEGNMRKMERTTATMSTRFADMKKDNEIAISLLTRDRDALQKKKEDLEQEVLTLTERGRVTVSIATPLCKVSFIIMVLQKVQCPSSIY